MIQIDKYERKLAEASSADFTGSAINTAVEIEVLASEAQNAVAEVGPVVALAFPPVHVPDQDGPDDLSMETARPWRASDQAEFLAAHRENLAVLNAATGAAL